MGYVAACKGFDEAKDAFILFASQLINCHTEGLRAATQLNYLYATLFRGNDEDELLQRSVRCHKAMFDDIVMSDPLLHV
jgi:hypothetical protein